MMIILIYVESKLQEATKGTEATQQIDISLKKQTPNTLKAD
ncbi:MULTISPECIES: hypothetical protein [Acinetobacter]|nr:hypothetical protein [Acinetobacter ihumii]